MTDSAILEQLIEEKNAERKAAYDNAVKVCQECRANLIAAQSALAEAEKKSNEAKKARDIALREYLYIALSIPSHDIMSAVYSEE